MPATYDEMRFPSAGLDVVNAFMRQPNRAVSSRTQGGNIQPIYDYRRTARAGVNVMGWEPGTDRLRGGVRWGLRKYLAARPGNVLWISQHLTVLASTVYPDPGGGMVQPSQSGRTVTVVAVSQGNVYSTPAGGTVWTLATNNTGNSPPLNYSGLVYSAANNQKLYFADGINFAYFDPSNNTVNAWTASAGTLPIDSAMNAPRLIVNWRDRIVVSGLIKDPQNIFASAVANPNDFNYGNVPVVPTQAWALNLSPAGTVGDAVTTLIPYNDDNLVVGMDHTIRIIRGDPMDGGHADLITDEIGMAWGLPWCKDPYGTLYFFSNRCGIYSLDPQPGNVPQRISRSIDPLLRSVNTGSNVILMNWNDADQGLHVWITPATAPAAATHFFWEWRSNAWWPVIHANNLHNPVCSCQLDGNTAADRVLLIGSWDGYVRAVDPTATDDDGTAIASSVLIGPILGPAPHTFDDVMVHEIQGILGETSGSVSFSILNGNTAEAAANSTAVVNGTFAPSRNLTNPIRRAAHATYVRIDAVGYWAMETIRTRLEQLGLVRGRGK